MLLGTHTAFCCSIHVSTTLDNHSTPFLSFQISNLLSLSILIFSWLSCFLFLVKKWWKPKEKFHVSLSLLPIILCSYTCLPTCYYGWTPQVMFKVNPSVLPLVVYSKLSDLVYSKTLLQWWPPTHLSNLCDLFLKSFLSVFKYAETSSSSKKIVGSS